MKRLSAPVAAWMTALVLFGASAARADFMDYSYKWSLGPGQGPTFTTGNSNVSFALQPGASAGASTLPVGAFSASSSSLTTDSFSTAYDLKLTLTDNPSSTPTTLTWHGLISGSVGPSSSSLTNTFSSPTQTTTLAGHVYSITLEPASASIPSPSSNARALIDAAVTVSPSGTGTGTGTGTGISKVPEPSALLLAGSGLAVFGLVRRRKQARANAS